MKAYADLYTLSEDDRIDVIGRAAMTGQSVAFVTDSDPGKADRYIKKLLARWPKLQVVWRADGPGKGVVSVRVELMKSGDN